MLHAALQFIYLHYLPTLIINEFGQITPSKRVKTLHGAEPWLVWCGGLRVENKIAFMMQEIKRGIWTLLRPIEVPTMFDPSAVVFGPPGTWFSLQPPKACCCSGLPLILDKRTSFVCQLYHLHLVSAKIVYTQHVCTMAAINFRHFIVAFFNAVEISKWTFSSSTPFLLSTFLKLFASPVSITSLWLSCRRRQIGIFCAVKLRLWMLELKSQRCLTRLWGTERGFPY